MADPASSPEPSRGLGPASEATRRRGRRRRRLAWGAVVLVFVVVAAVIAVQLVLWSDVPKRMVIRSLEQETGLRIEAGKVEAGWLGRTTVRDLVVGLPGGDRAVLTAPLVRVRHAWLPVVVWTGDPGLKGLTVEGGRLELREDDRGVWNLSRLIDMVAAAQERTPPATTPGPTVLPEIEVIDSRVVVSRQSTGASVELPLRGVCGPQAGGAWIVDATLGATTVKGHIASAGWWQQLAVHITGMEPVVAMWRPDAPTPIEIEATWAGRARAGETSGVIAVTRSRVGDSSLTGAVRVMSGPGGMTVAPDSVSVLDARIPGGHARVRGGEARLDERGVWTLRRVVAEVSGVGAEVSGRYDAADAMGAVDASWSALAEVPGVRHFGTLSLTASVPEFGARVVEARIGSTGEFGQRRWRAEVTGRFSGASWDTLAGTIAAPTLLFWTDGRAGEPVALSGFTADLAAHWPVITLDGLGVPSAEAARATGRFDASDRTWSVNVELDGWKLPTRLELPDEPATLRLRARGEGPAIELNSFVIDSPDGRAEATGSYQPGHQPPLAGKARISGRRRVAAAPAEPAPSGAELRDGAPLPAGRRPVVRTSTPTRPEFATLEADAELAGEFEPLRVRARSAATLTGVPLGTGTLGDIRVEALGEATEHDVRLDVSSFSLFGGSWSLGLRYDIDRVQTEVEVRARKVRIQDVAALLAPGVGVAGRIRLDATVRAPGLDFERASIDGRWGVFDITAGPWQASEGGGRVEYSGGRLRVHEGVLTRGPGGGAQLLGGLEFAAADPRRMNVQLEARRWPVSLDSVGLRALVDGHATLRVDTIDGLFDGPVSVHADTMLDGVELGPVDVSASVAGRTLNVQTLQAAWLGGRVTGRGTFPLGDWTTAHGDLDITGVDLSRLGRYSDSIRDVRGTLSGSVAAEPVNDPAALGPLKLTADLVVRDGFQRGMSLGDLYILGYAGPGRIILDRAEVHAAGGVAQFWSRLTWHDGEPFLHSSVRLYDLRLDQLARAADPSFPDSAGIIRAEADVGGYVFQPHRAYGQAAVMVDQADLARVPIVSALYGLLNVQPAERQTSGRGVARLRLEGDRLEVARFHYFNRGVDIIGSGEVRNVWEGSQSQVSGAAAGALRPLRSSDLPFARELDRLFRAATSKAVSVRVDGTVHEPRTRVVPLADIGETIRRVLGETPPTENP